MSELRIKQICAKRNITLKQLAQQMDLKPESLSRSLSGNPTLSTLSLIAETLHVDITDLFEKPKAIYGHIEYDDHIYSIHCFRDLELVYKQISILHNQNL